MNPRDEHEARAHGVQENGIGMVSGEASVIEIHAGGPKDADNVVIVTPCFRGPHCDRSYYPPFRSPPILRCNSCTVVVPSASRRSIQRLLNTSLTLRLLLR